MNLLFHKLNGYEGWEKYWEQSIIQGEADATHSAIRCKIFHEKVSFFGRKQKVSVELFIPYRSHERTCINENILKWAKIAGEEGRKWKAEISKWVNESGINDKGTMIELAEMALVTSDPYVKDAFITKWLSKVKPIK